MNISDVVDEFYRKEVRYYKKIILVCALIASILISTIVIKNLYFLCVPLAITIACFFFVNNFKNSLEVNRINKCFVPEHLLSFMANNNKLELKYKVLIGKCLIDNSSLIRFSDLSDIEFAVIHAKGKKAQLGVDILIELAKNNETRENQPRSQSWKKEA